jgi:hypothetical protein
MAMLTDVLAGGDAAEHATGLVRQETLGDISSVLGAELGDAGKAGADLDALHGVDAHHGVGDVGVEAVEHRLAPADGHAAGDHVDARADRIARLAQIVHVGLELGHDGLVGRKEGVAAPSAHDANGISTGPSWAM